MKLNRKLFLFNKRVSKWKWKRKGKKRCENREKNQTIPAINQVIDEFDFNTLFHQYKQFTVIKMNWNFTKRKKLFKYS